MSNAAEHALKLSQWMRNMKTELTFVKSFLAEIENKNTDASGLNLMDLLESFDDISSTFANLEQKCKSTEQLINKEKSSLIIQMEVLHKIFNQFKTNLKITSN